MELSLMEMVSELEKSMPQEPVEADENSIKIVIKVGADSFSRRFNKSDKIKDIKNFLVIKVRTFNQIEISEGYPKKIFSDENASLDQAGVVNNCVLMGRVIQ